MITSGNSGVVRSEALVSNFGRAVWGCVILVHCLKMSLTFCMPFLLLKMKRRVSYQLASTPAAVT